MGDVVLEQLVWSVLGIAPLGAGMWQLLAERSRRKTLVALVTRAPAGTQLMQRHGVGGPAFCVRVGDCRAHGLQGSLEKGVG